MDVGTYKTILASLALIADNEQYGPDEPDVQDEKEHALSSVHVLTDHYHQLASITRLPPGKRRQRLRNLAKLLREIGADLDYLRHNHPTIDRLADDAEKAAKLKATHPRDEALAWFLLELADLYEAHTGEHAEIPYNPVQSAPYGPFLDLCSACLRLAGLAMTPDAIREAYRRASEHKKGILAAIVSMLRGAPDSTACELWNRLPDSNSPLTVQCDGTEFQVYRDGDRAIQIEQRTGHESSILFRAFQNHIKHAPTVP